MKTEQTHAGTKKWLKEVFILSQENEILICFCIKAYTICDNEHRPQQNGKGFQRAKHCSSKIQQMMR